MTDHNPGAPAPPGGQHSRHYAAWPRRFRSASTHLSPAAALPRRSAGAKDKDRRPRSAPSRHVRARAPSTGRRSFLAKSPARRSAPALAPLPRRCRRRPAWSHRRSLVAPATLPPKATAIARYSGLVRRSPPHAAASRQGCTGGQAAAARAASAGRRAGARGGDVECKLRAPPSSSRGWPSDCARAPACGRGGKGPAARPQPGRPPPYPPIARAAIGPATDPRR